MKKTYDPCNCDNGGGAPIVINTDVISWQQLSTQCLPIIEGESLTNILYKVDELACQVQGIQDGGGQTFDTLADAEAVDPKPADFTPFQVSETGDPDNAGYWYYLASEPNGVKFNRPYIDTGEFILKDGYNTTGTGLKTELDAVREGVGIIREEYGGVLDRRLFTSDTTSDTNPDVDIVSNDSSDTVTTTILGRLYVSTGSTYSAANGDLECVFEFLNIPSAAGTFPSAGIGFSDGTDYFAIGFNPVSGAVAMYSPYTATVLGNVGSNAADVGDVCKMAIVDREGTKYVQIWVNANLISSIEAPTEIVDGLSLFLLSNRAEDGFILRIAFAKLQYRTSLLLTSEQADETYLKKTDLETTGENLIPADVTEYPGYYVSAGNGGIVGPGEDTILWRIPVTGGISYTIEWEEFEDFRPFRWEFGPATTVDDVTLIDWGLAEERSHTALSPSNAEWFAFTAKRPSENNPPPTLYFGPTPEVTSIDGFPIKSVSSKLPYTGATDVTFTVGGIPARIRLPNNYNFEGGKSHLMITGHGNNGSISYGYNANFLTYAQENNIVLAIINIQDETTAPFTTMASGYGNPITVNRLIDLYEWCQRYLNVDASVVLQGQSMGGLTVGVMAAMKHIPVRFLLQIGSTPDLLYRFQNASGSNVLDMIRNAYGMDMGGADDANAEDFFKGNDWHKLNTLTIDSSFVKTAYPPTYIYVGNGDTVFDQFGGTAKFEEVRDMILAGGQRCTYTEVNGVVHGAASLWDNVLADGIFDKELKLTY